MHLLNHFVATSGGAGGRRTRGSSGAKFGVLDGAFGASLANGSVGFSSGFFGFWIENLRWFRGANWFFDYSAFLLLGEFLFFL